MKTIRAALSVALLVGQLGVAGCFDTGGISGSFDLEGTGFFAEIESVSDAVVTAQSWSCNELQLVILEQCESGCYLFNDYVSVGIYLPPPLFVGRTYGRGTRIWVTHRGMLAPEPAFVTEGGITVRSVEAYVAAGTSDELTLDFDLTVVYTGGGTSALETLTGNDGTLRGSATFHYGGTGTDISVTDDDSILREDCLAPQFESGDEANGGHIVASGTAWDELVPDAPPASWGTEVNRIEVEDRRSEWQLNDTQQSKVEVTVRVTPPAKPEGNAFCEAVHAMNAPLACPGRSGLEPFTDDELPVTFVDRFGLRPTLAGGPEAWGYGTVPVVTAPTYRQVVYAGEPLDVVWDPSGSEGGTLTLEVTFDATPGLDPWGLALEDSGATTLDVPWPEDYAGEATLVLRRTWEPDDPFPWPVAPGSSVFVERRRAVTIQVERGGALEFPPPGTVAEGWTVPEALGDAIPRGVPEPVALLRKGQDGRLWATWVDSQTQRAALRTWDPAGGAWGPDVAPGGQAITHGPLQLTVSDELALFAGYRWNSSDREYVPVARTILPDGMAGGGPLAGVPPHERPFGFASTVLADGTPVVAFADDARNLYVGAGAWDEPLTMLVSDGTAGQGSLSAYARADGGVDVWFATLSLWKAWRSEAGDPLAGRVSGVDAFFGNRDCATRGVADPDRRHAHFVCIADYRDETEEGLWYRRFPLMPGDPQANDLTEPVALPFGPFLEETGVRRDVALGPDGSVWFAQTVDCEHGWCVVLARRTPDGVWEGPWLPGHVTSPPAIAVDDAGRVHLIYADGPANSPTHVVHTYTEVAP